MGGNQIMACPIVVRILLCRPPLQCGGKTMLCVNWCQWQSSTISPVTIATNQMAFQCPCRPPHQWQLVADDYHRHPWHLSIPAFFNTFSSDFFLLGVATTHRTIMFFSLHFPFLRRVPSNVFFCYYRCSNSENLLSDINFGKHVKRLHGHCCHCLW